MSWPLSQDYNEAIQSPRGTLSDPDLQRAEVVTNPLGLPIPRSGNFADVYEMRSGSGRWAVKCFTREVPGLRERYAAISRHLAQAQLPFIVDFAFVEQGIRIGSRWFPIVKMQWVEGLTLNELVRQYADRPPMLQGLLHIWARMAARLREAGIAHADLQHGNVLLVPGSSASSLAVKLVDYDGMFVPALAGSHSGEVGHPCYQHPQRLAEQTYSLEVDRFPLLLVATALDCLRVGGKPLWEKYDSGDNLLFREADLQAPVKSPLFYELLKLGDERASRLVRHTLDALRGQLEAAPLLQEVLPELQPTAPARPTTMAPPKRATAVKATPAPSTRTRAAQEAPAAAPFEALGAADRSRARRRRRAAGRPWLAGVAVLAVLLLVGGLAALALLGGPEGPKAGTQLAQKKAEAAPAVPPPSPPDTTPQKGDAPDEGPKPKEPPVAPPDTPPKKEPPEETPKPKEPPVSPSRPDRDSTEAPPTDDPPDEMPSSEPKSPRPEEPAKGKPEVVRNEDKPAPDEADKPAVKDAFVALFNGKNTAGWERKGKGEWKVDSSAVLVGEGADAALVTERRDFRDFTLRAELSASADAEAYVVVRLRRTLDDPWRGMSTRIFGDGSSVWAGQADAAFTKNERGIKRLKFQPGESFKLDIRVLRDVISVHTSGELTAGCQCRPDPVGGVGLFVTAGVLRVSKLEIKEVYRQEGALEGEELKVVGKSGDFPAAPQAMTPFRHDRWSGDAQLFCQPRQKGAWVDVEVPVAAGGKYQVTAYLSRARDYGVLQLSLNGKPLSRAVDGFNAAEVVRSEALDLGTVELKKGSATLRMEVVDTNEKSVGLRYLCGLDCLVLKPAASAPGAGGDRLADAREAAGKTYEKACREAETKMLAGFDAALDRWTKSKAAPEVRLKWIDLLKAEKNRFDNQGLIPFSEPMRPHVASYFAARNAAEKKLSHAYKPLLDAHLRAKNEAMVDELRAELKTRLNVRVLGRWRFFVNGGAAGVRTLYSNGKFNNPEGALTWDYAKGVLVFQLPTANAPGGAWIDTLQLSADGTTFAGTNNDRPERRPKLTGTYLAN